MRDMGLPPEPVPPNKKPKKPATTIGVSTLTTRTRRSRKKIAMSLRTRARNAVRVEFMCRAASCVAQRASGQCQEHVLEIGAPAGQLLAAEAASGQPFE